MGYACLESSFEVKERYILSVRKTRLDFSIHLVNPKSTLVFNNMYLTLHIMSGRQTSGSIYMVYIFARFETHLWMSGWPPGGKSCFCISRLTTFPDELLGSASTTLNSVGSLYPESRARRSDRNFSKESEV